MRPQVCAVVQTVNMAIWRKVGARLACWLRTNEVIFHDQIDLMNQTGIRKNINGWIYISVGLHFALYFLIEFG